MTRRGGGDPADVADDWEDDDVFTEGEEDDSSLEDSRLGCVVVVASFVCGMVIDGVCNSFGMLLPTLVRHLGHDPRATAPVSWVGSLCTGCYLFIGPFSASLGARFGYRPVGIAGGVIATLSFLVSAAYPQGDIGFLILTYGVLPGLGFGLVYLQSIVVIGDWFTAGNRALASGIVAAGPGVGSIIAPYAITQLLAVSHSQWQCIAAYMAALSTVLCVASSFLVKSPRHVTSQTKCWQVFGRSPQPAVRLAAEEPSRAWSISDSTSSESSEHLPPPYSESDIWIPAARVQLPEESTGRISKAKAGGSKRPALRGGSCSHDGIQSTHAQARRVSIQLPPPYYEDDTGDIAFQGSKALQSLKENNHITTPEPNEHVETASETAGKLDTSPAAKRESCCSTTRDDSSTTELVRMRLRKGVSRINSTASEFALENFKRCSQYTKLVKHNTKDIIISSRGLQLVRRPSFSLLLFASALAMAGNYIPWFYLPSYSESTDGATLLMILAIFNLIGRLVFGYLSDTCSLDPLVVNNVTLVVAGGMTALLPAAAAAGIGGSGRRLAFVAYSAGFGLFSAAFISLRVPINIDLFSKANLNSAYGLQCMVEGVMVMISPPLIASTCEGGGGNDYSHAFVISGCLIAMSGLICLPLKRLATNDRERQEICSDGPLETTV